MVSEFSEEIFAAEVEAVEYTRPLLLAFQGHSFPPKKVQLFEVWCQNHNLVCSIALLCKVADALEDHLNLERVLLTPLGRRISPI